MRAYVRERVEAAILNLTAAINNTSSERRAAAGEQGDDVDSINERIADTVKLMPWLRTIRRDLEDLGFVELL